MTMLIRAEPTASSVTGDEELGVSRMGQDPILDTCMAC